MTDDLALLTAVHELVESIMVHARPHGPLPAIGAPNWYTAPVAARLATLLVLAEAWLATDPEQMVAERFKQMSVDLSEAYNWSAAALRPSYAELQRRRSEAA